MKPEPVSNVAMRDSSHVLRCNCKLITTNEFESIGKIWEVMHELKFPFGICI